MLLVYKKMKSKIEPFANRKNFDCADKCDVCLYKHTFNAIHVNMCAHAVKREWFPWRHALYMQQHT